MSTASHHNVTWPGAPVPARLFPGSDRRHTEAIGFLRHAEGRRMFVRATIKFVDIWFIYSILYLDWPTRWLAASDAVIVVVSSPARTVHGLRLTSREHACEQRETSGRCRNWQSARARRLVLVRQPRYALSLMAALVEFGLLEGAPGLSAGVAAPEHRGRHREWDPSSWFSITVGWRRISPTSRAQVT
jgi:hypothetical protein